MKVCRSCCARSFGKKQNDVDRNLKQKGRQNLALPDSVFYLIWLDNSDSYYTPLDTINL